MAATISPVARVLSTTELLEAILENFLLTSLLHSQQVCKRWQAVIQESNTLQRKLYLKADASERVVLREGSKHAPLPYRCEMETHHSQTARPKLANSGLSGTGHRNPTRPRQSRRRYPGTHAWILFSNAMGGWATLTTSGSFQQSSPARIHGESCMSLRLRSPAWNST